MTQLVWDQVGERVYETGIEKGVLYLPDGHGAYPNGVAWNGLTAFTESPQGAAPTAQYADNKKYLNLYSVETLDGTLEAFTYPDEFQQFDGLGVPTPGLAIGQQHRKPFGLCYKTLKGNDTDANDHGYKLHLLYGCQASPSDRAYHTVNDTPAPNNLSWKLSTTPVDVEGYLPTSLLTIDSTEVDPENLAALEQILYGTDGVDPALPLPDAVIALFAGEVTRVSPTAPTYNGGTHTITIPATTGVEYLIDGEVVVAGSVVITEDTLVVARPTAGYVFNVGIDNDWLFEY